MTDDAPHNAPPPPLPAGSFAYQAQTADQQPVSGTIDALTLADARTKLARMNLRILDVRPEKLPRPRRMAGEGLIAFNQQLAQLAQAGLPLEQGLRLIAREMHSRRLGSTVEQLAAELERGTPVGEAFQKHAGQFPPLYGQLVAAGMRSNNLPAMLLNVGRHMEVVARLRAAIWRAAAYPLVVLAALAMVLILIGLWIVPGFRQIIADMGVWLPPVTKMLFTLADIMPLIALAALAVVIGLPLLWRALRASGRDQDVIERFVLPLPVIGPVLRRNLIARWCDVVRIGVDAGHDLPGAIELAGQAIASPALQADGQELIDALSRGADGPDRPLRLVPATVPPVMSLSVREGQLSQSLEMLSVMYQEQALLGLTLIPALLTPVLLIVVALVIGFVILALFAPLIALLQSVT